MKDIPMEIVPIYIENPQQNGPYGGNFIVSEGGFINADQQLMNPSFTDNKIPTMVSRWKSFDLHWEPQQNGPYGGILLSVKEGFINADQQLMNPSFTDNKIPTMKDIPMEIVPIYIENPQQNGPYGGNFIVSEGGVHQRWSAVDEPLLHWQ